MQGFVGAKSVTTKVKRCSKSVQVVQTSFAGEVIQPIIYKR